MSGLEELKQEHSKKKLENLLLFRMVWESLVVAHGSEIMLVAAREWASRQKSALDCLIYAIELVTNGMINDEQEKLINKKEK